MMANIRCLNRIDLKYKAWTFFTALCWQNSCTQENWLDTDLKVLTVLHRISVAR